MKDLMKYLNKVKVTAIIVGGFSLVFLVALFISDSKDNAYVDVVSVIGVAEEKIFKDARFDLDFVAYGVSEEDAEKQINDKIIEIKGLIDNFDQIIAEDVEKNVAIECALDTRYKYPKQFSDTGECLSHSWRANSRIKVVIKGDQYTDDMKDNFLALAPGIVNAATGPTFVKKDLDENLETRLLGSALKNARNKADKMATESNKVLGEVIEIDENPLVKSNFLAVQSDEAKSLNPGEDSVKKEVLVKYRLK